MKNALIAALVAAVVAGGSSAEAASRLNNGRQHPSKIVVRESIAVSIAPGHANAVTAYCPAGYLALSGGGDAGNAPLTSSVPSTVGGSWVGPPDSWAVRSVNTTSLTVTLQATVVCRAS